MIGSICSKEQRAAGNIISFSVDESNYNQEASRVVSKNNALDGTVLTTNWGYPEGNISISISNAFLTKANYNILIGMKEDDDNDFLFSYLNSTWQVIIESVNGEIIHKDKVSCTISLSVVEKYEDMETS